MKEKAEVCAMANILKDVPRAKKRVYVLIGNEPFDECWGRIRQVIDWGCEPYAQPMIALNATRRIPVILFDNNVKKLRDLTRWTNRWIWRKTPFEKYDPRINH